jgi:hypothetical protein
VTLSLAVVCEAPADQRTGCDLADRVFCAEVTWLETDLLQHCRQWRGVDAAAPCVFWRDLPTIARAKGIRAHGHFEGEPGKSDAAAGRRALRVLMSADVPPDAVVMLRDEDRDGKRRQGLDQARHEARIGVPVAIGVADTMRECWVLAGFEPRNDAEQRRLDSLRRELGFDLREKSHLLKSRQREDKRCPKGALSALTEGDFGREEACWRDTDLVVLKRRGEANGLRKYLTEVQERLAPLMQTRS